MTVDKEWWRIIPVSINNAYGDPLTDIQIMDTYDKINKLYENNMRMSLCTKAVPSKEVYEILKTLPSDLKKMMFFQYSLTALDEGGYSFKEREEAIYRLYEILGQVTLMIRPVIPGKNDNIEDMTKIIQVASKTGRQVILGGIHDENKRKVLDEKFYEKVINLCQEYGVEYFNKTSCAAANQFQCDCWMHDLGTPINLEILDFLEYDYYIKNDRVVLRQATTGDLNFVKIITKSKPYTERLLNNYNILSFKINDNILECTSSWFSWSNNISCKIACDYCIIRKIDYLLANRKIGCFPGEINKIETKHNKQVNEQNCIKKENISEMISYDNLRKVQECRAHAILNF
ncbi:hypothetical protein ABFV83_13175 [Lacrimispora sp. BS-2]|uniref:Radical SAM protein n=1 Tax=Lacrimispora sp. BS-2 TaxID=3151850 RepID=A0AAU7PLW6_9FIRM